MNTAKITKNIQKISIRVSFYINKNEILEVAIIAKSKRTRLSVILCEIFENV